MVHAMLGTTVPIANTDVIKREDIPFLTKAQMLEVDRAMTDDFHINLMQMMENAGRNLAHLARSRFLASKPVGKRIIALAGGGGNGGGVLAAARHLHNWGASITVVLGRPENRMKATPRHQLEILQHIGLPIAGSATKLDLNNADLVLDGLIGYSLAGAPSGNVGALIEFANEQVAPILALDVPSGLDPDTGKAFDPTICAAATLTLALPKEGLRKAGSERWVGDLYLGDIGVPPELYARPPLNINVSPTFARSEILRLR
ncbi:MAG: NAD(P)H-hydrate epimerase [Alphaproteobacteria bacterium]|nr:NAD(P)H-hydrate epimerase [Alphaproteobacteria bacterium]